MKGRIIEATNGPEDPFNWGKFLVQRPDRDEWSRRSALGGFYGSLLRELGWGSEHVIVFDLQTMEGAAFPIGGIDAADLHAHRIHVCVLFEPFLEWLYDQDLTDLGALPDHVDLPNAAAGFAGYRRPGVAS